MTTKEKYVYLLNAEGTNLYKIGYTASKINDRISQLQTGSADNLKLVCTYKTNLATKLESILHRKFELNNKRGEWFELNESEVHSFLQNCKDIENGLLTLQLMGNPFV